MSALVIAGLVFAGLAVGFSSALFGVGGGVLMVPLIVLVLGRSQHVAEGTSLMVVVPTAIAGVLAHRGNGYVQFRTAMMIAAAGVCGAVVGAAVAVRLPQHTLQVIFGVFLALTGVRLVVQSIRKPAPSPDSADDLQPVDERAIA
jgi:uncharacterized protein